MATVFLVATPIGNLEDIGARALRILREAPVIACEDTRRTWALLSHFGIPRPRHFVSYRQGREDRTGEHLAGLLESGLDVALCSDAGCPGISDPGYRLVRLALERGIPVEAVPGPSAVHSALVVSGLSTASYTFKGYAPRKPGALRRFFEQERALSHTLVLFESPYRVGRVLAAARDVLGDRAAAVCIELTKKHERVKRGTLSALAAEFEGVAVKGEVTIVIAGRARGDEDPAEEGPGEGDGEQTATSDLLSEPEGEEARSDE